MNENAAYTLPVFDEDGTITGTKGSVLVKGRLIIYASFIISANGDWPYLPHSKDKWFAALTENVVDLPQDWGASPYRFRHHNGEERLFQKTKVTRWAICDIEDCHPSKYNPIFWVWERLR
jgi:hypothetical protein